MFHYIVAGIAGLFSCFPIFHIVFGIFAIISPEKLADESGNVPPPFFGWLFALMGGAFMIMGLAYAICLMLSGRFLARQEHYLFCLVMAGISCLFAPFGTVLGVFTIIVLMRESVKENFT